MAQPDRSGLSNPYAPLPATAPARSRTGLARAAVLAGVGGAATLGLAGPGAGGAWADTSTAVPVSRYDDRSVEDCVPVRGSAAYGDTTSRTAAAGAARRCRIPVSWWRQGPVERPLPAPPRPAPPLPAPALPAPLPKGDPVEGSRLVSVEGTVEAGVEPGCAVLRDGDGQQWTLNGPLSTLPHGVPFTVAGVTAPDVLSTCQQGEVLRVLQVSLLDPAEAPGPTVPIATTDLLTAGARPITVSQVYSGVEPACGPIGTGKIPSMARCTR